MEGPLVPSKHKDQGLVEEEEEEGMIQQDANITTNDRRDGRSSSLAAKAQLALDSGVYMPPAKRRQLMEQAAMAQQQQQEEGTTTTATTASTIQQQRSSWQEEKRVIHGTINRLNAATIKPLIHDLFNKVNLLRLRGVLAKSILQAAISSPRYSNVYAALVAVLNTKLPEVGELVVKRSILAFRRYYRQKSKANCVGIVIFIGHLFHQAVVHELLVLQILTLLLDGDPTDDSVEVAVQFLSVIGQALLETSPAGVRAVLERLRALLHEGNLNKRVEYKIEQLLKSRKTGFRNNDNDGSLPIPKELDLVERDDQITFELSLDDEDIDRQDELNVFSPDKDYDEKEQEWSKIRAEILGLGGDDEDGDSATDDDSDEGSEESEDEEEEEEEAVADQELAMVPAAKSQAVVVQDLSEADLVHLRRTIYLTIMSSASFEECTHKLTKIDIPAGRESELINMLIECCSQERTFLRYYGLISARFCLLDDRWRDAFMEAFEAQYTTIHRLETNKLRNVAKLFAHLLHTDSMPWSVLSIIHLNEDETTSSSRIFVKILVQEMAEAMGIAKLKQRLETDDPVMVEWYKGMFPKDNVRNTRYAINFFTSIGLGPLTDDLREFLKNAPKMILAQAQAAKQNDDDDSSVSTSSSDSSSSLSSSSSSSSYTSTSSSSSGSSSSYSRRRRHRRRRSPSYSSSSSSSSGSESSYSSDSRSRGRRKSRGRRGRDRKRSVSSSSSSDSRIGTPDKKKQADHERSSRSRTVSRSRSPENRRDDSERDRRLGKRDRSPPRGEESKKRRRSRSYSSDSRDSRDQHHRRAGHQSSKRRRSYSGSSRSRSPSR